jgi:Rap1a immunity proteins
MWALAIAVALRSVSFDAPPMVGLFDSVTLAETCRASGQTSGSKQSVCLGYIAGAIDQLMMSQALKDSDSRTICPPAGMTLDTATQAVLDRTGWAASTGKGLSAAGFVKFAMEDAFPCRRDADVM